MPVTTSIRLVAAVTLLILAELIIAHRLKVRPVGDDIEAVPPPPAGPAVWSSASFVAYGDVNLGRTVGQRILKGAVDHPFAKFDLREDSADIVFLNLESPLSDQGGETVSPKSNIVFTGPPEGARTLRNAGVTVVSTANNHALDYGVSALGETVRHLDAQNILHAGTSTSPESLFLPLLIEKNSIKIAIFAVSAFVNFNPKGWERTVAPADTGRLFPAMRAVRKSADFVLVSYHGGVEYTNAPAPATERFAAQCIDGGADIVLGHHPHVTFGVHRRGKGIVVHSLGNFIFFQPQHYWTQRSYGVRFVFEKREDSVRFRLDRFIPVKVGFQTERMTDTAQTGLLRRRTQRLSNFDITSHWK